MTAVSFSGGVRIHVSGARGPRGLASGALGAGSVDAETISDSASEQAAISAKLKTRRSSLMTAGEYRTLAAKAEDRFDIRDMLGMDITGANDMASSVQDAVADAASTGDDLHIPGDCIIALGSSVAVPSGVSIVGEGTRPYTSLAPGGSRGPGSWFHLAHSGVGFTASDNPSFPTDILFRGIGTFRDQPAPVPGWEPVDHDFDFVSIGSDLQFDDVMMLNATRGFRQVSGGAARSGTRKLRGQPFLIGAQIDDGYEGWIAENIRWWPFWSNDDYTRAFTLANRKGLYLKHIDNPLFNGYFDIFSRYSVCFGKHPNGVCNAAEFIGADLDAFGETAVYSESDADGASALFNGGKCWGAEGSSHAVTGEADSTFLTFDAFSWRNLQRRAVLTGGTGNKVVVNNPRVQGWNIANDNSDAFAATPGNAIIINGTGSYSGGNGAPRINNIGLVASSEWISQTVTPFPQTGSITSASATHRAKREGNTVTVEGTATITNNGGGAGLLRIPMPVPAAPSPGQGSVFQCVLTNGSGKVLRMAMAPGATYAEVVDGTSYPVTTGATLSYAGSYEVSPL